MKLCSQSVSFLPLRIFCITCCLDYLHHYAWCACSFAGPHICDGILHQVDSEWNGGPSSDGSLDRRSGSNSALEKQVSMIRKYNNYTLQTNPCHHCIMAIPRNFLCLLVHWHFLTTLSASWRAWCTTRLAINFAVQYDAGAQLPAEQPSPSYIISVHNIWAVDSVTQNMFFKHMPWIFT